MNLFIPKNFKTKPEFFFWFFLFITVFGLGYNFRMQSFDIQYEKNKYNVITSDGIGYYSYLPSTFISKNFQKSDISNHYLTFDQNPETSQNKYFIGSAILMSPFFALAHTYTTIDYWLSPKSSYYPNGYSFPYHLAICLAGVFYLILGLFYIKKLGLQLGIKKSILFFLIIIFALGTQLLELASYESSFSHIYAFFTIAAILYYWLNFTLNPSLKYFLITSSLLSLLILIRPTDLLIILTFPMFLSINGRNATLNWLKEQRIAYLYMLLIGSGFLFLQLIYWKLQSGSFFIWSYSGEGFDFSNPEFFNVLFSYKKGLFVYTPLVALSCIYLFFGRLAFKIKSWFLLFFIVNTYVISSWWCWWYGGSYGMRPWMDFLPIIIIILAYYLNQTKKIYLSIFYVLAPLSIPINIIQTYQYSQGIMHWDQMTKDKFWQIFLKTDKAFHFVTFDHPEDYKKHKVIDSTTIDIKSTFDTISFVEKHKMFHTLLETPSDSIFSDTLGTYVKIKFKGKVEFMGECAVLTCNKNIDTLGMVDQQAQRVIEHIRRAKEWINSEAIFDLGYKKENETNFSIFFYNNQKNYFWFKDVSITFYNYKLKPNDS